MIRKLIITAACALALVGAGVGATALANTSSTSPQITACVNPQNQVVHIYAKTTSCALPNHKVAWNQVGLQGVTGKTGSQGPSGVQAVNTVDLNGLTSANDGGSFNAGAQEVGTGTFVAAGTYEVCMNAKATPEAAPQAGTDDGISAQFFLYDQVKNANFAGDLLNISTPLQADGTNHDAYANGCTLVTVPTGGQVFHVYAFGYQQDTGAGNFNVDDITLNMMQLTPAS